MQAAKELKAEVRADIAEFDENAADPETAMLEAATAAVAAKAAATAKGSVEGPTDQGSKELSDTTRRICNQFDSIEAEVKQTCNLIYHFQIRFVPYSSVNFVLLLMLSFDRSNDTHLSFLSHLAILRFLPRLKMKR